MPLNAQNQRTFHRTLYATQLQTVTINKRKDDQKEGTIASFKLFECRWSAISKQGEALQGDMAAKHYRRLHIPRISLDRVGINYINTLDQFLDVSGRLWQNESTEPINVKLFEVHVCVECRLIKGLETQG